MDDPPSRQHTIKQAEEFAQGALTLMRRHLIPPCPQNFTVWYFYCCGELPELNKALDTLVATGETLDDERNSTLYHKFCGSSDKLLPVHVIAERIEAELAEVLTALQQAGRTAHEYGISLRSAARKVTSDERAEDILNTIARLMSQTRTMALNSRELEKQLLESSIEIGSLKVELEGARREAKTDALTGIANRKMFEYELRTAIIEADNNNMPLSLLMLDIDHFKKFNDDHGHVVGDNVLRILGLVLRQNVKGQDTVARYGGEEFAAVLPRTKGCDARKLADTIRQSVASKKLFNRKTGAQLGKVSVSVGVAQHKRGEPAAAFVDRADEALYAAKRLGRNRVVAHEDICGKFAPRQDMEQA